MSRFGREVSPGPPTRRSQTTTTTTRRPLAVTHGVLPSSGVPTYSGYQRTERPNEASVDAAHPNGPDLSARKTHAQQFNTFTSHRPTEYYGDSDCWQRDTIRAPHFVLQPRFASFVLSFIKSLYFRPSWKTFLYGRVLDIARGRTFIRTLSVSHGH